MKNHIAFKFLPILLCAACLLGAVGSGAAMLVLTELDGYNSSVPERYADLLENESLRYAQTRLVRYVESSQPGFPTAIDYSDDGTLYVYNPFPANTSGYEILDGEGNVVEDKTGAPLANPVTYTFPAEGTYRKVVSIEPYEEPEEETVNYTVLTNKLPSTGTVEVCGLSLEYAGSSSGMYGETPIAYAMVKADGGIRVIFFDDGNVEDMWQPDTLLGITLYDRNNEILYVAHGDDGVGEFSRDQNDDLAAFESFATTVETDEKPARTGTVDGYVNVYSAPSLDSGVLGSLGTGFPVEITATTNVAGVEWGYVPDMGWLRMNQVTLADDSGPDTPFVQAETEPTATGPFTGITTSRATGYAIPDTKADVVGTCDKGCTLEVYQQTMVKDTLWFYTDSGWIPGKAITLTQAPEGMDESALSTATLAITTEEVPIYTIPAREEAAKGSLKANTTLALTRQIDVEGETWGYLMEGGWVSLGAVTLLETSLPVLPQETAQDTEPVETIPEETLPAPQTLEENGEETEVFSEIYWDSAAQQTMQLHYTLEPLPDYTLVLYLEADVRTYSPEYDVMMLLWSYQDSLVKLLGVCLLLFAVLAVYLCCAAGRKPGSGEIHPAAFNALPLDLYLVGGCLAGFGLGALGVLGVEELLEHDWQVACGLGMGMGYGICLIFVGFCFACAAQFKTPGGYWWRNTLCVRVARLCWWLCRWLWRKCVKAIPWLGSLLPVCFGRLLGKGLSLCADGETPGGGLLGVSLVHLWHYLFKGGAVKSVADNGSPADDVPPRRQFLRVLCQHMGFQFVPDGVGLCLSLCNERFQVFQGFNFAGDLDG